MRELMGYPPFSFMVRILVSDYEADGLLAELGRVAKQLQLGYPALEFLGPSGKLRIMSAASTPTVVTLGKSKPLATICVPIKTCVSFF